MELADTLPSPARRALLVAAGAATISACAPTASDGSPTGPAPTTVPTTSPTTAPTTTSGVPSTGGVLDARLVVDKLTFGPRPGLIAAVEADGVRTWIDRQLDPVGSGVPSADHRLGDMASLRRTHRQNYAVQTQDNGVERLRAELDTAAILRAVASEQQLLEVMVDLWSNHFNVWRHHTWRMFMASTFAEQALRPHALGRFDDLLSAVVHHTAMLEYLDAIESSAAAPGGVNQNLGRELLELHTLGIADGIAVHTEADVAGVAAVLSGWSIEWRDGPDMFDFLFRPWQHSLDAVNLLGGAFTRPARTYGEGYDDGVRLLWVLAHHPATARHIARVLCRRFVGDRPDDALVASTAAVFTANETAIAPTLRHIFESDAFAASARSKARRPLESVVACLRATGATLPDRCDSDAATRLRRLLGDLGQPLHERRTPDGYPDDERSWASPEAMLRRWSAGAALVANRLTAPGADGVTVDAGALVPSPLPATVGGLLHRAAIEVTTVDLSTTDAAAIAGAVGLTVDAPASTLSTDPDRWAAALGLLLAHPTFQRR